MALAGKLFNYPTTTTDSFKLSPLVVKSQKEIEWSNAGFVYSEPNNGVVLFWKTSKNIFVSDPVSSVLEQLLAGITPGMYISRSSFKVPLLFFCCPAYVYVFACDNASF